MEDRKKDRHKHPTTSIRFQPKHKKLLKQLTEIEQTRPVEVIAKALEEYAQAHYVNITEDFT